MLASSLITNDAMNSRFMRISFRFMPFMQDDCQEIMPRSVSRVISYDRSSPGRRPGPLTVGGVLSVVFFPVPSYPMQPFDGDFLVWNGW